jgi:hypothetical protein
MEDLKVRLFPLGYMTDFKALIKIAIPLVK